MSTEVCSNIAIPKVLHKLKGLQQSMM